MFREGCYSPSPSSTPRRLSTYCGTGSTASLTPLWRASDVQVSLEDHVPEAVVYIASVVGRELPQPVPMPKRKRPKQLDGASDEDDSSASREPRVRGRAPIFEPGQRAIASLVDDVERGVIALPDLQRPFVWEDTKVRDLLDSLFVGFPVGTLVFWHTTNDKDAHALGAERPGLRATTLVIDGQQRLTALYAVMKGLKPRRQRRRNEKDHYCVPPARRAIRGCRRGDPQRS